MSRASEPRSPVRAPSISSFGSRVRVRLLMKPSHSYCGDVASYRTQLARQVLVATGDVVGVRDQRLTVGAEGGDDEGGTGAYIWSPHRRAGEAGLAANNSVVSLGADVGSHADELVDVSEAAGEQVLGDDADPFGHGQHGDEEGLVVGGDPRIRQRRDVDGAQPPLGLGPHAAA